MEKQIKTFLYDILDSINEIESYFVNKTKVFNDFVNDTKTKRAIERNLEIIGEAISRISKIDKDITISNSRQIIDIIPNCFHKVQVNTKHT